MTTNLKTILKTYKKKNKGDLAGLLMMLEFSLKHPSFETYDILDAMYQMYKGDNLDFYKELTDIEEYLNEKFFNQEKDLKKVA